MISQEVLTNVLMIPSVDAFVQAYKACDFGARPCWICCAPIPNAVPVGARSRRPDAWFCSRDCHERAEAFYLLRRGCR